MSPAARPRTPAGQRQIPAGIANDPFPTPEKGKQEQQSLYVAPHSFLKPRETHGTKAGICPRAFQSADSSPAPSSLYVHIEGNSTE